MGLCCSCNFPLGRSTRTSTSFLASHYAHHWFNPWNEKWFAGFSQTTYPPLTHQWIALVSNVAGLKMGYMLVQLIAVLLLPVGVFRFAKIWVDDRAASYAALGSIFPGRARVSGLPSGTVGHRHVGGPVSECVTLLLRVVDGSLRYDHSSKASQSVWRRLPLTTSP